ncbi:hypothetical protein GCM10011344_11540 [Dokdonia pacifica]|nr:hypothetical protein GCM10011344_11540 [Dokdonia pacifica]
MNVMKKLLFLGILCISSYSNAQIFVNDIDRVAVVIIDYCVNENGERYDITINQEKSSYKDEAWQKGCLDHFKKSTLLYPMKLTNHCWQSVYYFVNSIYKDYELPEQERAKCKAFHLGNFKYENPAYSETIIKRRKNRQIEKGTSGRQVYSIEWTDDHTYILKTEKLPSKIKHKKNTVISVEIIEVLNEHTYLCKSKRIDIEDSEIIFGLITKL